MTERFQKTVQALEQGGVNSISLLAGVRDSSVSSGIEAVDRTEMEPGRRKSTDNYRRINTVMCWHHFRKGRKTAHLQRRKNTAPFRERKILHKFREEEILPCVGITSAKQIY